jgi:S1-C subfamily serine protease
MSNIPISGNFFGRGPPSNRDLIMNDTMNRFPVSGDRWVDILTGTSYVFDNVNWNRVTNMTLNDIPNVYNENIDAVVTIVSTLFENFDITETSTSSGFFISPDGFIVSVAHAYINSSTREDDVFTTVINVLIYPENIVLPAILIGVDPILDFTLFKVSLTGYPPRKYLPIIDSRNIKIGTPIIILGTPGIGQNNENDVQFINFGIVTNNRYITNNIFESIICSCNVTGGNSGGPLITLGGKVIGYVSSGSERSKPLSYLDIFLSTHAILPVLNIFMHKYLTFNTTNQVYQPGFFGIKYNDNNSFNNIILKGSTLSITQPVTVEGLIIPTGTTQFRYLITEVPISEYGIGNNIFPSGDTSVSNVFPNSPASSIGLIPGIDIIMSAGLNNETLTSVGTPRDIQDFKLLIHYAGPTGKIDIQYRKLNDAPPYSILYNATGIGLTGYPSQFLPFTLEKIILV